MRFNKQLIDSAFDTSKIIVTELPVKCQYPTLFTSNKKKSSRKYRKSKKTVNNHSRIRNISSDRDEDYDYNYENRSNILHRRNNYVSCNRNNELNDDSRFSYSSDDEYPQDNMTHNWRNNVNCRIEDEHNDYNDYNDLPLPKRKKNYNHKKRYIRNSRTNDSIRELRHKTMFNNVRKYVINRSHVNHQKIIEDALRKCREEVAIEKGKLKSENSLPKQKIARKSRSQTLVNNYECCKFDLAKKRKIYIQSMQKQVFFFFK